MKAIFKIMIFSIMLNFAVGMVTTAIQVSGVSGAFDPTITGGLEYDSGYAANFEGGMNQSINPSGVLEDKGNAIYRVLDMVNLGFIARFLETVDQYMFGFLNMMKAMFGGAMNPILGDMVFGALKIMITIGYILGAWWLWTGRDLDDE